MRASERGKVGGGFDPDAKRGKVDKYVKCRGGGGSLREGCPISWSFFFFFFFFFCNQFVIMFKGTKDSCSVSYGDKKPVSKRHPARFTSS